MAALAPSPDREALVEQVVGRLLGADLDRMLASAAAVLVLAVAGYFFVLPMFQSQPEVAALGPAETPEIVARLAPSEVVDGESVVETVSGVEVTDGSESVGQEFRGKVLLAFRLGFAAEVTNEPNE